MGGRRQLWRGPLLVAAVGQEFDVDVAVLLERLRRPLVVRGVRTVVFGPFSPARRSLVAVVAHGHITHDPYGL